MSERQESKKYKGIILAGDFEDDTEFIPLISDEDEEVLKKTHIPNILSVLPLRNTVLFPGVVIPITVGRKKSLKLVREAYKANKPIGVITQKLSDTDEPQIKDLYRVGTIAQILKILEMPDGSTSVIIQGKKRFQIESLYAEEPYLMANVTALEEVRPLKNKREFEAIIGSLKDL